MGLGRNNTNRGESAVRVKREKQPEQTVENVPDEIVEKAVWWASCYAGCPECNTEQWFFERPGWNTTVECSECGSKVKIIG